ncbi:TRL-like family protein [Leptospira mtsangambouensis]|uniref:TRL-like family protein n=1 Tax=Leptospira mtsangambouensis TaxID=2484912 RepID=UPI001EEABF7D|nr:TRL-like family protein [Leptospira mtsangambouensis]MCG6140049.1 TRL-like family protein [Leptospira mtsangambouensis]
MMISSSYKTNSPKFWTKNLKNKSTEERTFVLILILCSFFSLTCASSGFGTQGLLYEDQRIGMMETGLSGTKEGIACAKSYLGLLALGDASVETSQKNGNIREITSIELETYNFLGIYAKLCAITRGN